MCCVGHFDKWQLIFYGTNSTPVNLMDDPRKHTKPAPSPDSRTTSRRTVDIAATSTTSLSASTVAARTNVTVDANVSVSDANVTSSPTIMTVAKPLTPAGNYSFPTSYSPSSNASVVKNLTMKDSDAENSTELKSGVLTNGTFATLRPPAIIPGRQVANASSSSSEENGTSSNFGGFDSTLTGAPLDSGSQNAGFVFEPSNVTDGLDRKSSFTKQPTRPAAVVNVTASFLDSKTAQYGEMSSSDDVATSSLPALLHGQVRCLFH